MAADEDALPAFEPCVLLGVSDSGVQVPLHFAVSFSGNMEVAAGSMVLIKVGSDRGVEV